MLDKNFIPPSPEIAERESKKRLDILQKILPSFAPCSSAIMVSGSMAYGQNYSVTEKSDIDTQILVTKDSVQQLLKLELFDREKLKRNIEGYLEGIAQQFSVSALIDNVSLECHLWDKEAFIAAVTLRSESTTRLRSSSTPPSIDFGYAFDGEEDEASLPGHTVGKYITGQFPSFRRRDGKLFLCRPATNILGNPLIFHGEEILNNIVRTTWTIVIKELAASASSPLDLSTHNIFNTLPGKQKASPAFNSWIRSRTIEELEKQDIKYTD